MIEIKKLKDKDKGKKVIWLKGEEEEREGKINEWTKTMIFVDFGNNMFIDVLFPESLTWGVENKKENEKNEDA